MQKLITLIIVLACITQLQAQHSPQYTNFMFNKVVYNPAFAGNHETMTFSGIYRNQWTGLDGAPETVNFNLHTPFLNNRCGLGLSVVSDRIGNLNSTYVNLSYAYRMPVGTKSTLSIGLMGRLEHGRIDWTNIDAIDQADQLIGMGQTNEVIPNFGAGLFLSSEDYYIGLSAPQMLKNNLYSDLELLNDVRSYYAMAGIVKPINSNIKFKPAVLMTYNPSAPFEIDFNASLIFMDVLWVGGSYRLGDSFDGIVAYQFTQQLRAGLAVDFTTSELRNYTSGSFEVMVQYSFLYDREGVQNLRYF